MSKESWTDKTLRNLENDPVKTVFKTWLLTVGLLALFWIAVITIIIIALVVLI